MLLWKTLQMLGKVLIGQANCLLINRLQIKLPIWMIENGVRYYDSISGLLLRATLTDCCGVIPHLCLTNGINQRQCGAIKPNPGARVIALYSVSPVITEVMKSFRQTMTISKTFWCGKSIEPRLPKRNGK